MQEIRKEPARIEPDVGRQCGGYAGIAVLGMSRNTGGSWLGEVALGGLASARDAMREGVERCVRSGTRSGGCATGTGSSSSSSTLEVDAGHAFAAVEPVEVLRHEHAGAARVALASQPRYLPVLVHLCIVD